MLPKTLQKQNTTTRPCLEPGLNHIDANRLKLVWKQIGGEGLFKGLFLLLFFSFGSLPYRDIRMKGWDIQLSFKVFKLYLKDTTGLKETSTQVSQVQGFLTFSQEIGVCGDRGLGGPSKIILS